MPIRFQQNVNNGTNEAIRLATVYSVTYNASFKHEKITISIYYNLIFLGEVWLKLVK